MLFETLISYSAAAYYGPIGFFAALMFNFVAGVNLIVIEKELKLRDIMKMMGLYVNLYC